MHTKAEGKNLPFAERRGRVQAKRRTQGMHEIHHLPKTPFNSPLGIKGEGHYSPRTSRRREVVDGNTVTDFVHPLRASHASPSLREGEDTPPTTNLRQTNPTNRTSDAIIPPMPHEKYQLKRFARDMRNNPTDPERALWYQLRMRRLDGRRFLRQKVIAGAIVDFVCPQAKLVIELDGGQHDIRKRADELRTGDLNRAGYRVIRFWNQDISNNIDGVLETISQALRANT